MPALLHLKQVDEGRLASDSNTPLCYTLTNKSVTPPPPLLLPPPVAPCTSWPIARAFCVSICTFVLVKEVIEYLDIWRYVANWSSAPHRLALRAVVSYVFKGIRFARP